MMTNGNQKNMMANGLMNGNQKNMMANGKTTIGNMMVNGMTTIGKVNGMKTGNQKNMTANGLTKTGSQKKIMKDQCAIVMTNVKSTTIAASMKTNVQKNMTII